MAVRPKEFERIKLKTEWDIQKFIAFGIAWSSETNWSWRNEYEIIFVILCFAFEVKLIVPKPIK